MVFPTPASPTKRGLFFSSLTKISMILFISSSLPNTTISSFFTSSVRFLPNSFKTLLDVFYFFQAITRLPYLGQKYLRPFILSISSFFCKINCSTFTAFFLLLRILNIHKFPRILRASINSLQYGQNVTPISSPSS